MDCVHRYVQLITALYGAQECVRFQCADCGEFVMPVWIYERPLRGRPGSAIIEGTPPGHN